MSLVETRQLPFDPSIDEYSATHHLDAPYNISDKLYYDFQLTKSFNAYDKHRQCRAVHKNIRNKERKHPHTHARRA